MNQFLARGGASRLRIIIHVEATVGSSIGKGSDPRRELWPVGWGKVRNTIAQDGGTAEAVVLMREPAFPGRDVVSRPVAVLHLEGDPPHDVFLCVSEDRAFDELRDLADLPDWHAGAETWRAALDRFRPEQAHRVVRCGSKDEADRLLSNAHRDYDLLTGSLGHQ